MSSSAQTSAITGYTGNSCDEFTAIKPTDRSSGLRRWSRNLSAQRHQELNRLNQIERRRHFLELKRQNDLFDKMSVLTNSSKTDESESRMKNSTGLDKNKNKLEDLTNVSVHGDEPKVKADRIRVPVSEIATSETNNNTLNLNEPTKDGTPINGSSASATTTSPRNGPIAMESRLTSLSSPEEEYGDGAEDKGKGTSAIKIQLSGDQVSVVDSQAESSAREINGEKETVSKDTKLSEQLASNKRPMMTNEQLTRFVSMQVPVNKRVLCLIVRDKMSRLNKAKSYFYPNYYLFIQAIVDINESMCENAYQRAPNDDSSLATDMVGSPNVSTNSQENSFSASSSISADMLFIGAANSGNGANVSNNKKLPQSSYSDNEACADTETEDDFQPRLEGSTRREISKPIQAKTSALQGRNSPLVFPNRDVSSGYHGNNNNININTDTVSDSESLPVCLASNDRVNPGDKRCTVAAQSCESTEASKNIVHDYRTNYVNGRVANDVNRRHLQFEYSEIKATLGELSIEDSNEDGDDLDDDSDNDESDCKRQQMLGVDGGVGGGGGGGSGGGGGGKGGKGLSRPMCSEDEEVDYYDTQENLFDNARNPYTGTYGVLLAGRRRKKAKTYLIGPNEYGYTRKNSICKLKSNVLGTQFNAIRLNQAENNDRYTIASITYETNVLGFKGPRKMKVFLAKDSNEGLRNLPETFKKNPNAVVQLKNMTPSWNVESQSYVLNFHGRVTQASVKNFQLIECLDHLGERHHSAGSGVGGGGRQTRESSATGQPSQISNDLQSESKFKRLQSNGQQPCTVAAKQSANNRCRQAAKMSADLNVGRNFTKSASDEEAEVEMATVNALGTNNRALVCGNEGLSSPEKDPSQAASKALTYNSSIVMQFGRISNHEFTCDVTYPLSILQAFAIALSSFDSKLACE